MTRKSCHNNKTTAALQLLSENYKTHLQMSKEKNPIKLQQLCQDSSKMKAQVTFYYYYAISDNNSELAGIFVRASRYWEHNKVLS